MGYRGEDLDLRTPQGWNGPGRENEGAGTPNWWTRSTIYSGGRSDPIWVDDTVLACCNHAFDLAAAHRAGEVRLEHLLHALALDDTGAAILEARGIRTAGLKRETAGAIAELAQGHLNGKASPRKSEDLEEILRHAADRAYPRGTPVTVEDLLVAMFDSKRDVAGLGLLYRHAAGWLPREERQDVRLEPLPHLSPRPAPAEYRLPNNDEARTRAAQSYFNEPREPRQAYREPARESLREPAREFGPSVFSPAAGESQAGVRMDGLERAFKDLSTDISDERKTFQSFLVELKRNVAAQTDDTQRFRGGINERLKGLEDMLQRSRQDSTLPLGGLAERLSGIEHALEGVERTFQALFDRLSGIERQIASRSEARAIDLTPVEDRIATFERTLLARVPQGTDLASVTELLSGIETRADDTARNTTEIGERLVRLERSLDNRTAETGRTVSFVGERLRAFEEQLTGQKQQAARIEQIVVEQIAALGQKIGERLEANERVVGERLQAIAGVARSATDEVGRVNSALETVTSNQRMLASAFDQWRLDAGGDLGVIDNRVQGLETAARNVQPQIEQLAGQVAVVHAIMAKREANKSHLRNWLFGTDDWYSASWNTQRWRQTQSALDEADARLERTRAKPVGSVPVRR